MCEHDSPRELNHVGTRIELHACVTIVREITLHILHTGKSHANNMVRPRIIHLDKKAHKFRKIRAKKTKVYNNNKTSFNFLSVYSCKC